MLLLRIVHSQIVDKLIHSSPKFSNLLSVNLGVLQIKFLSAKLIVLDYNPNITATVLYRLYASTYSTS